MAVPNVLFYQYETANTTIKTTLAANQGDIATWNTVSAGAWTSATAFKIQWQTSDTSPIAISNARLWVNRSIARHKTQDTDTSSTEVDIGEGFGGGDYWSIMALYTQPDHPTISSVQAVGLTDPCPTACLETGDNFSGGNAYTMPAVFRGDTSGSGIDLELSATLTDSTLYSKFIGISFLPPSSALRGIYSNIGIQVTYDFS